MDRLGWLVSALALTLNNGAVVGTIGDGRTTKIDVFLVSLSALAVVTVVWGRKHVDSAGAG